MHNIKISPLTIICLTVGCPKPRLITTLEDIVDNHPGHWVLKFNDFKTQLFTNPSFQKINKFDSEISRMI
jgi:hypothetical protein